MSEIPLSLRSFMRPNGRTVIVPIDHGTAIPVPGLERPDLAIAGLRKWADAFVVNYGAARRYKLALNNRAVCLRTDVYKPARDGQPALDENTLSEAWADLGASFGGSAGSDRMSFGLRSLAYPDLLPRAARPVV